MQPDSVNSAISVSAAPLRPTVSAPSGDDQAAGVDGLVGAKTARRSAYRQHLAVGDVKVVLAVDAVGRIDQVAVLDM
jgi:hypothetical protein